MAERSDLTSTELWKPGCEHPGYHGSCVSLVSRSSKRSSAFVGRKAIKNGSSADMLNNAPISGRFEANQLYAYSANKLPIKSANTRDSTSASGVLNKRGSLFDTTPTPAQSHRSAPSPHTPASTFHRARVWRFRRRCSRLWCRYRRRSARGLASSLGSW